MALTDAGISQTREQIKTLDSQKTKLQGLITELGNKIQTDDNYQIFRSGTTMGEQIDTNLSQIIEITNSIISDTESLVSVTNTFLDRSEAGNRKGVE